MPTQHNISQISSAATQCIDLWRMLVLGLSSAAIQFDGAAFGWLLAGGIVLHGLSELRPFLHLHVLEVEK